MDQFLETRLRASSLVGDYVERPGESRGAKFGRAAGSEGPPRSLVWKVLLERDNLRFKKSLIHSVVPYGSPGPQHRTPSSAGEPDRLCARYTVSQRTCPSTDANARRVILIPKSHDQDAKGQDHSTSGTVAGDPVPPPAVSPMELLEYAIKFTRELERTWSAALETEEFARVRDEAKQHWAAVIHALIAHLGRIDAHVARLGLDKTKETYPLDDSALGRLSLDPPTPEVRWQQLQISSFYVIEALVRSIAHLDEPTGRAIDIDRQVAEEVRWWQAGAFALVADCGRAFAQILDAQHELLPELGIDLDDHEGFAPDFGRLGQPLHFAYSRMAARRFIQWQWHEASLPYLLQWIRELLETAIDFEPAGLPEDITPICEQIPSLAPLSDAIRTLQDACQEIGAGRSIDLGIAIPLAEGLLERLESVFLEEVPREEPEEREP